LRSCGKSLISLRRRVIYQAHKQNRSRLIVLNQKQKWTIDDHFESLRRRSLAAASRNRGAGYSRRLGSFFFDFNKCFLPDAGYPKPFGRDLRKIRLVRVKRGFDSKYLQRSRQFHGIFYFKLWQNQVALCIFKAWLRDFCPHIAVHDSHVTRFIRPEGAIQKDGNRRRFGMPFQGACDRRSSPEGDALATMGMRFQRAVRNTL